MPTTEGDFDAVAIFRVLNRHEVAYVVVGGFAVAAWGVVRATDPTTPLTQETLVRREDRLFSTKHGQVHILNNVGTIPAYPDLMPAQLIEVDDQRVRVATRDQLRAMKTGTGRPKDEFDLDELGKADTD